MARVQISVRIDADVLAQVEVYAADAGIKRATAIERLVVAGLDGQQQQQQVNDADSADKSDVDVVAVLRENNADLRMVVSTLTAQLAAKDDQMAAKDDQISALTSLADHAQQLHAMSTTKSLAPAEAERVTLGERWRRWWHGL